MTGEIIIFYFLASVALITALGVITFRNPVYSALSLVLTLLSIAGLFLMLHAEFLAVIQVLTYAGAILVLFIFIIMLLNLREAELFEKEFSPSGKFLLVLVSSVAFVTLGFIVHIPKWVSPILPGDFGSVFSVGREIFTRYVIPFEVAGILLTVALIGAVLLAKKSLVIKS